MMWNYAHLAMSRCLLTVAALLATTISTTSSTECHRFEAAALAKDPARICRTQCTVGTDCTGTNTCNCDDLCGMSCFKPDAKCFGLSIPNGAIQFSNGLIYNSTATYSCNTGYNLSGQQQRKCRSTRQWSHSDNAPTCIDVDECTANTHNCHASLATCTNTAGGFTCTCVTGYQGNGVTCQDVDECVTNTHNCHGTRATCTNNVGSFSCACMDGYSGDGATCDDIDECTSGSPPDCGIHGYCLNNVGSYKCTCNAGFTGAPNCVDVNECTANTDNCHATLSTCTNTAGSFTCACIQGYRGDGLTCYDIDECAEGLDHCHSNAVCINTVGSFLCMCNSGYTGDGISCIDVNECADGTMNCHKWAKCRNIEGSFTCSCRAGFSGNGTSCADIDECVENIDNCHDTLATCTNNVGSFTCHCTKGYSGNGVTCGDIDECADLASPCGAISSGCTNTPGSFTCTCFSGFAGVPCADIDECLSHPCVGSSCTNSFGSFQCDCLDGYARQSPTSCIDIDECALATDNCHGLATCTNTDGDFVCACNTGFSGDGVTCEALWQPWGVWSECSSSCSPGLQVRKRLSVVGGNEGNETRPCNSDLCDKYSKDKAACIGKGKIPSACKLDALIQSQLNAHNLPGSTQDIRQSADGRLKAKITKFKAPGINLKFVKIRGERKERN